MEANVYAWHYALLVVHSTKEEEGMSSLPPTISIKSLEKTKRGKNEVLLLELSSSQCKQIFRLAYQPFCHLAFELRKEEIVMELIDAFDVGKHASHNLVGKHVMLAISKNHLEMENLQHRRNDGS